MSTKIVQQIGWSVSIRILLVFLVLSSIMAWPENFDPSSLPLAFLITLVLVCCLNTYYCVTFIYSYATATIMALVVYWLLSPLGIFDSVLTDGKASDSQFFLSESRRFLVDGDVSALFTTWGSLIPVLYGAIALKLFAGSYMGIVFMNSLLYTFSIFLAANIFTIPKTKHRMLPLLGLMPLQCFYNSMLAKVPIYLYLIVIAVYALVKINRSDLNVWRYGLLFFCINVTLILFRPTGAIILAAIAILAIAFRAGAARAILFLTIAILTSVLAVFIAISLDYSLPLFFVGSDGAIDFSIHDELSVERINSKALPAGLTPLFLPPWSIVAAPLYAALWMVSPLPLLGPFVDAIVILSSGTLTFIDFSLIVRYIDSFTVTALIIYSILARNKDIKSLLGNPLFLFGVLQVLNIVIFQFFESGRHRYLPGFILALVVIYFKNERKPPKI